MMQAQLLNFTLDESQWQRDWTVLLSLASQPGEFICCSFYPRWKDYQMMQAQLLNFILDESQWQRDWTVLLSLASQPGEFVVVFIRDGRTIR